MVLDLKLINLNNFMINITLKENYLHLIIPKAMVKLKHLKNSLRVCYPKLFQSMEMTTMNNLLMLCGHIE